MKHIFLILFLISFVNFSIAQEEVLKIKNTNLSEFFKNKASYSFSNQKSGELGILINEHQDLYAYLINADFNKIDELKVKPLKKTYKNYLGYKVNDKKYSLVFTNNSKKKYGIVHIDFNNHTSEALELDFVLKKEEIIKAFSINNRFFLLTIIKYSDTLIIRELIDNSFVKIQIPTENTISLYDILLQLNDPSDENKLEESSFIQSKIILVKKIQNKSPNSIEVTSELNKIYTSDNSLIFTFDNFDDYTLIYEIDLENFKFTKRKIGKDLEHPFVKSNSYIFENYIFQIQSSIEKMIFSIKDFKTGDLIKKYEINKGSPITLKNSPIIQEGRSFIFYFKSIREMELTDKYLRKITAGELGISVYKINDNYQITLGGAKEISGGEELESAPSSSGVAVFSYNPTYVSYGSYASTKSTFFHSKFDMNFEHKMGEIKDNVFDKITAFKDQLKYEDAINIFSHNDILYFGYFDLKNQEYKVYKFID